MNKIFKTFITFTLVSLLLIGCETENLDEPQKLILIDSYQLEISEPSGLSLSNDSKSLWSICDEQNIAFNISFTGDIIDSIAIDENDLEGITVINDSLLALVIESTNEVIIVTIDGREKTKKSISEIGEYNSGLEGITYDSKNKNFYVVNEKNPGILFKLDEELNVIEKYELDFAKDYSSVFFDEKLNCLWILSDQSKALYKTTLKGKNLASYQAIIPKPEGIAMNMDERKIFIVSDNTAKLYIFRLP